MSTITSRAATNPQASKKDVETCKTTLKAIGTRIKRLQEALPHLKEVVNIHTAFKLLQTVRISYIESKHYNKQLVLLTDSEQFKTVYTLSKETIQKVEAAFRSNDKSDKIAKIFDELAPTIVNQHGEIQSLQDAYLVSQIHSWHVALLTFIAEKEPSLASKINQLINTLQTPSALSQGNDALIPYTTQFPQSTLKLPSHLSFQNSTGFFHLMYRYVIYNPIKGEVAELETVAKDLYFIHTMLRQRTIELLSSEPSPAQEANYAQALQDIKKQIEYICKKLSSTQTPTTVHPGVYYGSRLQEFVQDVERALERFSSLIPYKDTLLKMPSLLFPKVKELVAATSVPVYTQKKLETVNAMVGLFKPAVCPQGKTFPDKQLKNIFLLCRQMIAKTGLEALETIESGACYETIIKRKSYQLISQFPSIGKEILKRRYFSQKPQWQLNLMLYNLHLYPETAQFTGVPAKIVETGFINKETIKLYKMFSSLFYEIERHCWTDQYQKHYLYIYSKYAVLLEKWQADKNSDPELNKAVSEKLEALQQKFQFPTLHKKNLSEETCVDTSPDCITGSVEELSFNTYARALWGTEDEVQNGIAQSATDALKKTSPLRSFFILKSHKTTQSITPNEQLSKILQEYLTDEPTAIGFRNAFGAIFCESLLFELMTSGSIDHIKEQRGDEGYSVWHQAMSTLTSKDYSVKEKQEHIAQLNTENQNYSGVIALFLKELNAT
jgi:hypothetical protein